MAYKSKANVNEETKDKDGREEEKRRRQKGNYGDTRLEEVKRN